MPTSTVWPKSCGFVLQAATEERLQSAVVSIWPIWACYEAKDSSLVFSFAHPTPATAHPAAAFFHALSKLFSAWPGKRAFLLGKKEEKLF
nr:MAG TPA: hypothetical protein [Caudoviricetes sp.]